ncbi:MAG: methylenetetrahydrofolate reductase [Proteobacteria bacterium]|nr:methylenetetrahydrofolate reductase [Pseudomonadota bacterium]
MAKNEIRDARSPTAAVAAPLMRKFSLEVMLPTPTEISSVVGILAAKTPIFVSAPPGRAEPELVQVATQVRKAGFEPIPHIAARNYPSHAALGDFIARICGEAEARRALVIAGDVDTPAGPFPGANSVIESDLLQHHGIREIGISGYPDGHPKLNDGIVGRSLTEKLRSAEERGIGVQIVSQFCFDADRIIAWLRSLRRSGITSPVRIGIAGPSNARALAKYALRCGVRNSFKAVLAGTGSQLLGDASSEDVIGRLGGMDDLHSLGDIRLHLYSFGGLNRTAHWASEFQVRTGP